MPSSLDTERASMPPALVQERRPWYDLGFSFTTRQALILLGFLVLGVAFTFALDWVIDRFVHLSEEQIVGWIDDLGALGPIAFILGIIGLIKARKNPQAHGTGHAIAGIVLGAIDPVLWIVLWFVVFRDATR